MKKQMSFAVRLSLRFMFILTTSILVLSSSFLLFVRYLVHHNQAEGIKNAARGVTHFITERYEEGDFERSDDQEADGPYIIPNLPYFITFIVYDSDTQDILATNDPFLPLLKETKGKVRRHFEKNFFFDGDLDILYCAQKQQLGKRNLIFAVAENNENNLFSMMFSKLPMALLFMAIPVLVLSFFVSLLITKNTITPVVKITRAARAMTTENLDGQLPLTGRGDEIDQLSLTFNDLFARIKADFDRERQFSSDVSHELNTPLTVISGQANLLLRWGKDNPEQLEKSLNAIKDESKSMHVIIENLLQISRVESGRVKPQICEVDVRSVFERVVQEFSSVSPDVKFDVSCDLKQPVKTDPEMLHQILTVLVSNSVKFAGDKCRIGLSAFPSKKGSVVISESDDGPGMSRESLPHVFERFYRGDEAHTRSAGGSGLGLSIARTLTDALGGEISAGNLEPHGARFQLYLPA